MNKQAITLDLGRIEAVEREQAPALSRDVPLDLSVIQSAWPEFESAFDSLRGRQMFGIVYNANRSIGSVQVRLDRDADNPLVLAETTIPGGRYLRQIQLHVAPTDPSAPSARALDLLDIDGCAPQWSAVRSTSAPIASTTTESYVDRVGVHLPAQRVCWAWALTRCASLAAARTLKQETTFEKGKVISDAGNNRLH